MRSLAALVVVLVGAACNPLAPQPQDGDPAGTACTADLSCADGLACECGTCAEVGAVDEPPLCEGLDVGCPDTPSTCIASCADTTVVGAAECRDLGEVCADGVLATTCDCLGPQPPGTICQDGTYVCQFGTSPIGGCYTQDCVDPQFACVDACGAASTVSNCVASAMVCDLAGYFPESECGGCVGTVPACLLNCTTSFGPAACDLVALDWSCAHILPADGGTVVASDQCDAGVPVDGGVPLTDAGLVDGGPDAGAPDAGPVDAGAADGGDDAGQPADAGLADAGSDADSGAGLDAGADGGA